MSPEQLAGRKVDATTDLYSIGLLLYELLFGTVPQTEPVENDIARAALSRASKSTGAAGQEAVAPALLSVLGRALATERHVRHASAEAFLSALDGGSRSDALVGELRRAVRSRPFSLRTFALGAASLVLFSLILLLLPGEHGIKSTSPTNEVDKMVGTSRVSAAVASEPIAVRDFAGLRAGVQYEYDVQMNQDDNTTRSRLRLEVVVNLDPGKFLVRAEPGGYEYFLVVDDEENALYRQFNLPDPETGERRLTRSRLLLRLPPTTFRVSKGRTFHCSSDDGRRLSVRLLDEPVTVHGRSFTGCIEVVDVGSGERQVRYYKSGKGEVATEVFDSVTGVRLYSRVLLDDHESSF